ncbi:hypothetical protein WQ54_03085 [Bacillus sp. SA1-12]|uniref:hypothetical protein n=1 Tax=Bacillus sp. SA1-12 TaxID=1455638 RepID=UPI00062560A9|nr:hypothetical protein [Bacillus sp. SA1-12]KKI93610.1 hypothetical protein WQ54_03085 [Bacillus sp. SA1-12]
MDQDDQFEEKETLEPEIEFEQAEKTEEISKADRFNAFMFGSKALNGRHRQSSSQQPSHKNMSQKDEVNYFTIFEQLDDIMTSIENLKPVLEEISPVITFIKKKIKK